MLGLVLDHDIQSGALVLVRQASDSPIANATQIFVHTVDAPDTFARICAALESLDYSIHDARIYSDTDGSTLDTFCVLKNDGSTLDAHLDSAADIHLDRPGRHSGPAGKRAPVQPQVPPGWLTLAHHGWPMHPCCPLPCPLRQPPKSHLAQAAAQPATAVVGTGAAAHGPPPGRAAAPR